MLPVSEYVGPKYFRSLAFPPFDRSSGPPVTHHYEQLLPHCLSSASSPVFRTSDSEQRWIHSLVLLVKSHPRNPFLFARITPRFYGFLSIGHQYHRYHDNVVSYHLILVPCRSRQEQAKYPSGYSHTPSVCQVFSSPT